jgi:hypothetical protein
VLIGATITAHKAFNRYKKSLCQPTRGHRCIGYFVKYQSRTGDLPKKPVRRAQPLHSASWPLQSKSLVIGMTRSIQRAPPAMSVNNAGRYKKECGTYHIKR